MSISIPCLSTISVPAQRGQIKFEGRFKDASAANQDFQVKTRLPYSLPTALSSNKKCHKCRNCHFYMKTLMIVMLLNFHKCFSCHTEALSSPSLPKSYISVFLKKRISTHYCIFVKYRTPQSNRHHLRQTNLKHDPDLQYKCYQPVSEN